MFGLGLLYAEAMDNNLTIAIYGMMGEVNAFPIALIYEKCLT